MTGKALWVLICSALLAFSAPKVQAEFTFNLGFSGYGRVLVIPQGSPPLLPNPGDPSNPYFSSDSPPASPLTIVPDIATLTALPTGLFVQAPSAPISLTYGSDLVLDLEARLGIRFEYWSGSYVPWDHPEDFVPQDPESNSYLISNPGVGIVHNIVANFSADPTRNAIDTVELTFPLDPNPVQPTVWEFIENDQASTPGLDGILRLTMSWADLLPLVNVGQLNDVQARFVDVRGNQVQFGFDLGVNSPAAVPEPSSLILFSLVSGGYLGYRRKRRKIPHSSNATPQ